MAVELTFPVRVLREQTVALEAALTVCLADPSTKPVHRLRTATRRVEAQLLLLMQVPSLPAHRKETERLRHALKRLRQAAGEVRDLDVQRKQLEEIAGDGADAAVTAEVGVSGEASPDGAAKAVREGAASLRDHLKARREHNASALQDLLEKHGSKAARAAEKLLAVLEPAEETPLAGEELLRQAEGVFSHPGLLGNGDPGKLTEDELHTVRKAAKAARYLAETLPGADGEGAAETAGAKAAKRFEALQEAGGQWHDALELARAAKSFLGRRHALTEAIAADRDRFLEAYRKALADEVSGTQSGTQSGAPRKAEPQPKRSSKRPKGAPRKAPQTAGITKPMNASAAVRRPARIRPTGSTQTAPTAT